MTSGVDGNGKKPTPEADADAFLSCRGVDISYGPVPAGDFAVSPPAGAKTVDLTPRRTRSAAPGHAAPNFKVVAPKDSDAIMT